MADMILLALAVVSVAQAVSVAPTTQGGPESAILRRAAATLRQSEPAWTFIGGICNCPPLMDEQIGVAIATWQPKDGPAQNAVVVRIHRIANAEAASQFLYRRGHGGGHEGWAVTSYALADEADIATHRDPATYEICFRKGTFLAFVSAPSKSDAERFAGYVLAEMTDSR